MKILLTAFLLFVLNACGPREIGRSVEEDTALPEPGGMATAEQMRYPITGTGYTQKMLYYSNRPDIMESVQKWQTGKLKRQMGISPEDPEYRATPKQRSPFRQ